MLEFADVESFVEGALHALDDFVRLNRMQEAAYGTCEGAYDSEVAGTRLAPAIGQAAARKRSR